MKPRRSTLQVSGALLLTDPQVRKELVRMEMYEQELYQSELFTSSVTNAILDTLRAISGNVFTNVGFLDAPTFKAIIYESSGTAYMKCESVF